MSKKSTFKIFYKGKDNCVIQRRGINGHIKAMSPGLKLVCGFVTERSLEVESMQFNSLAVRNMFNQDLLFDISISFKIAGGLYYNDKDGLMYQDNIKNYSKEEKIQSTDEWVNTKSLTNSNDYGFNYLNNKIDYANPKRFWTNNHPIKEYSIYEDEINDERKGVPGSHIIQDLVHNAVRDAFINCDYYDINDMLSSDPRMKKLYLQLRRNLLAMGLQITSLNLKNIRMQNNLIQPNFVVDDKVIDKKTTEEILSYDRDVNPLDNYDDEEELQFEEIKDKEFIITHKNGKRFVDFTRNVANADSSLDSFAKHIGFNNEDSFEYESIDDQEPENKNEEIVEALDDSSNIEIPVEEEVTNVETPVVEEQVVAPAVSEIENIKSELENKYNSIINELNERILVLEDENKKLIRDNDLDQFKIDDLVKRNISLQEKINDEANAFIAEENSIYLESNLKLLEEQKTILEQRVVELEIENYELTNKIEDKNATIDELVKIEEENSIESESKIKFLEEEKANLEQRVVELEIETNDLDNTIEDKNATIDELVKTEEENSIESESKIKFLEEEKANLEQRVTELEIENYELNNTIEDKNNTIDELAEENEFLEEENKEYAHKNAVLLIDQDELDNYNLKLIKNNIGLSTLSGKRKNRIDNLKKKNDSLKNDIAEYEEKYAAGEDKNAELMSELTEKHFKIASLTNENKALLDRNKKLSNNNKYLGELYIELKDENEANKIIINNNKSTISELEKRAYEAEMDNISLDYENKELKNKNSNLENRTTDLEIENYYLSNINEEIMDEQLKVESKLDREKEKNTVLKGQYHAEKKKNEKLEDEKKKIEENAKNISVSLNVESKKIIDKNEKLNDKVNELEKELEKANNSALELTDIVFQKDGIIKDCDAKIAELKDENEKLKQQSSISNLKIYRIKACRSVVVKVNDVKKAYKIALDGNIKCQANESIDVAIYKEIRKRVEVKVASEFGIKNMKIINADSDMKLVLAETPSFEILTYVKNPYKTLKKTL